MIGGLIVINKTKIKGRIKLISVVLVTLIISLILIKKQAIDIQTIKNMGEDFQYNLISVSSVIAGFLFTGISILISVIDKENIKRLWDNNYLDNLYSSAFIGMSSNVLTIISSLSQLCCDFSDDIQDQVISTEILTLILGLVCFIWCIKDLLWLITRLKPKT